MSDNNENNVTSEKKKPKLAVSGYGAKSSVVHFDEHFQGMADKVILPSMMGGETTGANEEPTEAQKKVFDSVEKGEIAAIKGDLTIVKSDMKENGSSLADDFGALLDSIDDMGQQLEMVRKLIQSKETMEAVFNAFKVNEEDQNAVINKIQEICDSDISRIDTICSSENAMNEVFFTREDKSIIEFDKDYLKFINETEFQAKQEIVTTIATSYRMETSINKDISDLSNDVKELKEGDIKDLSAQISYNLKSSIEKQLEKAKILEDEFERLKKVTVLEAMVSSYTFKELIDTLDKYKGVVEHTIEDYVKEERIKEVGKRYRDKLKSNKVHSTLFGIVQDDMSKSIEATQLPKDDYVSGYENLFVFSLIRFFGMASWTPDVTKRLHNATMIVLTNMMEGNLSPEFRDEVAANIAEVWKRFKNYLEK